MDRQTLQTEISEFLADHTGQSLENFDLCGVLNGMTDIIRRHQIILPSSCWMFLNVLVMLEGTSRQLDPKVSLAELPEPYYAKAVKRRVSLKKMMHEARRRARDRDRLMERAPRDLADILDGVKRGSFDVKLEHKRLETTINRRVLGTPAAALFVASALLYTQDAPPLVAGVSVFGALGYALAAFWGFRLLAAVRKSGSISSKR